MRTKIFKEKGMVTTTVVLCHGTSAEFGKLLDKYELYDVELQRDVIGYCAWATREQGMQRLYVIWSSDASKGWVVLHELQHMIDAIVEDWYPDAPAKEHTEFRARVAQYWGPKVLKWFNDEAKEEQK